MGERKGVNKYYPPDYDPKKGGLNKFLGTHALRERARKLHMGILIIRFEMPYNIWCEGCENHIGTGVRYNAEKKKVGMYYSTPIYQFRMKCHLCDNHFEIKTDPANLDYVIVSGARRQERRWDPEENEQTAPECKETTRKLAADAMFRLEHGVDDKRKSSDLEPTLLRLQKFQDVRWKDDYTMNQLLRKEMREKRKQVANQSAIDAKLNVNVPLLPPSTEDDKLAKLMKFHQVKSADQLCKDQEKVFDAQSIFSKLKKRKASPATKKEIAKQSIREIVLSGKKNTLCFKEQLFEKSLGIVRPKHASLTCKDETSTLLNSSEEAVKLGKKSSDLVINESLCSLVQYEASSSDTE